MRTKTPFTGICSAFVQIAVEFLGAEATELEVVAHL